MINACHFETMEACASVLQTGSRRGSFADHKEKLQNFMVSDTNFMDGTEETRSIYAETRP